ncbi:MAG: hypothetical protein ACR2OA_01310 [Rubripirellula sp.]|jgi:hypothetical protein
MTEQAARDIKARRSAYLIFALIALALTAGRISVVTGRDGTTAFLSANDRSRWCTVASLVEHGTYAIDSQIEIVDPVRRHIHPWQTIDKVRHLGTDDKQHYYSSKPPLFPTAVAGVYKVVNLVTGMTLTDQPIYLARILLALVNLPLLALFYFATMGCIERIGKDDWSKRMAALGCCFGTMLLPFAISLNNHLPAATATAVVAWIYLVTIGGIGKPNAAVRASERSNKIKPNDADSIGSELQRRSQVILFLVAGAGAALAAANELPALSMLVFWFGLFAWAKRDSVLPFIAGVVIVALGFFGTNWLAHQSLRPPYAHRGNGSTIAVLDSLATESTEPDETVAKEIQARLVKAGLITSTDEIEVATSDEAERWLVRSDERQFALLLAEGRWSVARWDDWYEYPNTYWKDGTRRGVDQGEPSKLVYLFQMTFGHHGLFSLTPLWLLVPIGLLAGLMRGPPESRRLMLAISVASLVCFLFYLNRPLIDRNYGGVSVCFRWLLWFAPLWLLVVTPVMAWFETTPMRRGTFYTLLALSVFSMSASMESPWQSPWIYRFWQFLGWLGS